MKKPAKQRATNGPKVSRKKPRTWKRWFVVHADGELGSMWTDGEVRAGSSWAKRLGVEFVRVTITEDKKGKP